MIQDWPFRVDLNLGEKSAMGKASNTSSSTEACVWMCV